MQASQEEIISPRTAAVTAGNGLLISNKYDTVLLFASNLATTETVTVSIRTPDGDYVPVTDAAGDAVVLTATAGSVALEGGPMYSLVKSVTAGESGVYAILRRTGAK